MIVGGGGVRMEPLLVRAARGAGGSARMRPAPSPSVSGIEIGIAVALALLVAGQWAGPPPGPRPGHLRRRFALVPHAIAAHIAQTGSVTELLYTDPYLDWSSPQNSS